MAAKRAQEPLEQSEAERLRAERRVERAEAKRQKRELARIEREMRPSGPRWVLPAVAGGVVLLAIVVLIGYKAWGNAVVDASRLPFEESMEGLDSADKAMLGKYAAADWERVQDLSKKAEAGKGGPKAVAQLYRDADKLLGEALAAATEADTEIEFARSTFERLYKDAVALGVGELLPTFWARVEGAREKASAEGSTSGEMAKQFDRGTSLLEEVRHDFARIKVLRQKMAEVVQASASFTPEQHAKAFPEGAKAYQARLATAKDAITAREWKGAIVLHQKLIGETSAIAGQIRQAKTAAIAATRVFENALAGAKGKGAPRDAKTAWQGLVAKQGALAKAMAAFEYTAVKSGAEEATTKVAKMLKQITEARNTLVQRLGEAEQSYLKASENKSFYEANLAPDWAATVTSFQAMRKAVTGEADIVSQLRAADALKAKVDAITAQRKTLVGGVVEVQGKLAALQKNPLSKLVDTNLPQAGAAIARVSRQAKDALDRGDMNVAVAKYTQWTEQLGKAMGDVKSMMDSTTELARSCADRKREFQEGINRFRAPSKPRIEGLSQKSGDLLKQKNFKDAMPVLKQLDGLIPAQRFTLDKPGTVSDNTFGFMWASDGKGAGCLGGKKANWHEAFRWANDLNFAGHTDWRLPTEEELALIGRISAKERTRAFPNTPISIYWTGVPGTDVNEALAVDMKSAGTVLRKKAQQFQVRAMRIPK